MRESELSPCPFCGHATPYFERRGTSRHSCIVACGDCGCTLESSDEDDDSGESWNRRAAQEAQARNAARWEKLCELIDAYPFSAAVTLRGYATSDAADLAGYIDAEIQRDRNG